MIRPFAIAVLLVVAPVFSGASNTTTPCVKNCTAIPMTRFNLPRFDRCMLERAGIDTFWQAWLKRSVRPLAAEPHMESIFHRPRIKRRSAPDIQAAKINIMDPVFDPPAAKPVKAKKPAAAKKKPRKRPGKIKGNVKTKVKGCKPGRTRNARGICGKWKHGR